MIEKAQNTPLDNAPVLQRKLHLAAKTNPKRKFGVLRNCLNCGRYKYI